jgi:hypothetical protein
MNPIITIPSIEPPVLHPPFSNYSFGNSVGIPGATIRTEGGREREREREGEVV